MQKTSGKNCFHVCWYGCIDILSLSLHVVEFLLGLVLATLGDVIVIDGRFEPTSHLVWIWLDVSGAAKEAADQPTFADVLLFFAVEWLVWHLIQDLLGMSFGSL